MKGHISYWEQKLSFSPTPADEHLFEDVVLLVRIDGRRVHMVPDSDGNILLDMPRDRNAGLGKFYRWALNPQPWARWMRHEVEITPNDDGSFTFEIPLDHQLPWPRFVHRPGNNELDYPAIAVREFRLRARSAYFAGDDKELKRVLRGVPPKIKRLIRTQVWTDIVTEIREETPPWMDRSGTSCSTSRHSEPDRMQL